MAVAMDSNGNVHMDETAQEIEEYLENGENPTYAEFKDEYGGLKSAGLIQGPSAVVKEENQEIHVGEADLASIGEPLEDYDNAHKPGKANAVMSLATIGGSGASAFEFLRTGNPDYLTAGGVIALVGKDEIKQTIGDFRRYIDWERAKRKAIKDVESDWEDLDSFEIKYDSDRNLPTVGIDPSEMFGGPGVDQDLETGQGFQ